MKPLLHLHVAPQFVIPFPYRVWCHVCQIGFMAIEESQKHDRDNLRTHQLVIEKRSK
jgi:hypothetical protein